LDSAFWIADPEATNRFYGNQSVLALYALINYSYKKLSVMAGLRAEEALLDLDFRSLDTVSKTSYFAVYPTVHLGLTSGKNEWQLNYSKRVNRPEVDEMNPVPEYRDPRNIYVGNPNLKPEVIHSFELGYSFQPDKLTLVPTLFYRYKVNGFTRVTSSLNDTVLMTTMENLASDQSAGIDFSGSWQIGKVANVNFSASAFYNEIDASNIGYSSDKGAFSWNAKINASIYFTKTTLFQVNGQYRSEALTPQGYRLPSWVVNLGFRQDFWKKRISFVATVSDLFNSQAWKVNVDTPVLVQESTRRRDARVIYGGFVFNFGTNGKKSKEPKFEFDNGGE
jgi:outer membrane receptor protein involved in Fe transport